MIIVYGSRLMGSVDNHRGSHVATRFGHLWYLPLVPVRSESVFVTASGQGIPVPLNVRSILAAYLRVWAPIVAAYLVASGYRESGYVDRSPLEQYVAAAVLMAAAVYAWVWMGRLSDDARGMLDVYARACGQPIDVGQLGDARAGLRERLHAAVVQRASGVGAGDYRTALDPTTQWLEIALQPTVSDRDLLESAMTLARIEESFGGPDAQRFGRGRRELWGRLRAVGAG